MTDSNYSPISCDFHDILLTKATLKEYCKIQYFTDLRELITVTSVIRDIYTQKGEEFMLLLTGEVIRLDKIIAIAGQMSPNYDGLIDFTCDC